MKDKIGLVYTAKQPHWTSCISILSGLYKTYQNHFSDQKLVLYDYPIDGSFKQRSILARQILSDKLTKLVFISHTPNPKELIFFLDLHAPDTPLPPTYFHIYGDFSYQAQDWHHLNAFLKNQTIKIICASHSQQRFIDNLVEYPEPVTAYCPFPVDNQVFRYSPDCRDTARKNYNIKDDEFVFLYTGRMSIQKNIVQMCREFISFSNDHDRPCKLLLAGFFDDIGLPFFKINPPAGYYFFIWDNFLKELSPEQQERIVFLGSRPQNELVDLYHAADCYYSLSLYHDEDYGMSPIEALSCGTPAILTDWGGFPSFADNESNCHLVNVDIDKNGLNINYARLKSLFKKVTDTTRSNKQRESCSKYYQNHFSISAMGQYLDKIHSQPLINFPGFNWKLKEVGNYIYKYPTKFSFYEDIYSTYISKHPNNQQS